MLEYNEIIIHTHPEVYEPAEDSYLLADNLDIKRTDEVLEIGTGTGFIAISASKKAGKVIATDINDYAIKCAIKNVVTNKAYNIELKKGSMFEPVQGEKFDLILFNAPYLPTSEDEKIDEELNTAFDGGPEGRDIIDEFIGEVKHHLNKEGRIQLVQSSLADNEKTISKLEELGFDAEITARQKFFFEEIVVISGKLK
ncbi:MAG: HemK2/MTQ2 family protein methyltransferase [Methanobacterium sp.]